MYTLTMAYSSSTIVAWKYTYGTGNTVETLYTLAIACKDGTGKYGNSVETVCILWPWPIGAVLGSMIYYRNCVYSDHGL